MNKEQKTQAIADLTEQFANSTFFYLTDASSLSVAQINNFRRLCFAENVQMQVVKNTLVKKALEAADESKGYAGLYESLTGPPQYCLPKRQIYLRSFLRNSEKQTANRF